MSRIEADVARRYSEISAVVTVRECFWSESLWANMLMKDNPWDFLGRESWPGFEIDALAEHDTFRRIDHFFDRAGRTEKVLAAAAS